MAQQVAETFERVNIHIDGDAYLRHLVSIHQAFPCSDVMIMLKGNAYGHGLGTLLSVLHQAPRIDAIGVATLTEAQAVRAAGFTVPLFLMSGHLHPGQLGLLSDLQVTLVVHCLKQLDELRASALSFDIWLKLETGMHRLGLLPEDFSSALKQISQCGQLRLAGVMSHLISGNPAHPVVAEQLATFDRLTDGLDLPCSLLASNSVLSMPERAMSMVRPGLLMYGVLPDEENCPGWCADFQPVMTMQSRVIAIKPLKPGDAVGYDGTWIAGGVGDIAVVSCGYADGYAQSIPSGTPVKINDVFYETAGRVSMDYLTVWLGASHDCQVGDVVTLWGRGLPVSAVARAAGLSPYGLLAGVTARARGEC